MNSTSPGGVQASWAGASAIVGGVIAVALTVPFAAAYFLAYGGYDPVPFWLAFVEQQLSPALAFAPPAQVYVTYGRIYAVVFVLYLPAAYLLHREHTGGAGRLEKTGFGLVAGALIGTAIGVAGDYWADGIGYTLELLGLLVLAVGSTLWGIAILRAARVPAWWAWLLAATGPLAIAFLFLLGHLPSGPAFPFAVTWLLLGWLVVTERVRARDDRRSLSRG